MKINVNIIDFKNLKVEKGISLLEISKKAFKEKYINYLGARIENRIYNLQETIL